MKNMKEMMNEKKMGKMNKGIKSLKNLMQIFEGVQTDNTDKTDRAIFATFATFAMQIFKRSSVATLRTVPVKSTVKVAQRSRITSTRPAYNPVMILTFLFLVLGGFTMSAWGAKDNKGTITILSGKGKVEIDAYYKYISSEPHVIDSTRLIGVPLTVSNEKHNTDDGWVKFTATPNAGYSFYGWCEKSDCSDASPDLTSPKTWSASSWKNLNVVRYTKFTPISYTIAYNNNGGSGSMDNTSAVYDENVTLRTNTFYKRKYTVTYNANSGTCATSVDYAYCPFEGWKKDNEGDSYADGATVSNLTTTNGQTVTMYAQWGSGTTAVTLPTPTRADYLFEGWYIGSIAPANKIETATYTPSSNVTLVANWVGKYDLDIRGVSTTISNEAWNLTDAFNFVRADKTNMTVNIGDEDVIGYDMETNTITAKAIGSSTISFTQNTSATVKNGTSSEWTITVDSVANTLAVSGTKFTQYVDDEITSLRSSQNSNGTITTSSSNENLAYYDIVNNKIVIPNSDAQTLPFDDVTITISQAPTAKYKAKKHTITLTVNKYATSFSGSTYDELKVDDVQIADYSYSNVSAAKPTASSKDDFYYSIDDISYTNLSKNKKYNSLDSLVHFNPDNNQITALNAGTGKITFHQKETYKYSGAERSFDVEVSKHVNTIYANGNDAYSSTMYMDRDHDAIVLTATNTDYANYPITILQTAAEGEVSYDYNTSTRTVSVSSHQYLSTATWRMQQEENYKYQAGENTFSVEVVRVAEATDCYVLSNQSKQEKDWHGNTCHEHTWDDENAAGVVRFEISKDGGVDQGYKVQQYLDNDGDGNWTWEDVTDYKNDHSTSWGYWKSETLDRTAKGVRFMLKGGSYNYVRNVSVTRATYIEASNVTIDKTSSNNPVYPSEGTGVGTLTINYSIANGGDLKISNDNPKFTLSQDTISDVDCTTGTADINIQYNSAVAGEDVAHLVIYNDVYRKEVTVTGVCVKHDQSGEWKENIGTLKLGTVLKNPYSSTRSASNGVTYEFVEGDEDVITIVGTTLTAAKVGTATIQATVPSDDTYNSITSTIEITVTDDYVQYIVWDQDRALRHLKTTDDTFTLNASASSDVVECTTNGSRTVTYEVIDDDDAAGTAVTVEGNVLTIVRAGKAKVRASVARGEDADGHTYAAAQAVKDVIVRDPSALCEELYLYTLTGSGESTTGTNDIGTDKDAKYQRGSKTFTTGVFEYSPAYVTLFAKNRDDGSGLGTITVEQNVPSSGWISAGVVENPSATSWPDEPDMFPLRSDATQVRVVINQTKNYIYCGNIKVVMASFAKVKESSVEKEVLEFSSYIGTPQAKNVQVQWYSRRDLYLELPEGAPFTLSTDVFEKECEVANTDLRITFNTLVSQTNRDYELLITDRQDGGFRKTVVLRATATAETVTFSGEGNWTDDKWEGTPSKYVEATISKNADVTISTEVEVHSLSIASGASVTITPTGGLKVGSGGISSLSEKKIKLESNSSGQTGYIRISPDYEGEMPEADIELFSKAYYATGDAKMQYIGVSVDEENYAAKSVLSSTTYLYNWDESAGKWVNRRKTVNFTPFVGYATTQKGDEGGQNINYSGKLVSIEDQEIDLSYTESSPFAGRNLLANSYAAPIDISKFELRDFSLEDEYDTSVDYAIYLYNTGSKSDYKDTSGDPASLTAAGQYITVTPGTASALHGVDDDYPVVIPSMQGFFVKANAPGKTLKLNYKRLIYDANYATHGNTPLRVRSNKVAQENESDEDAISGAMKITLFTETDVDHLYLLESENYNKGYENGYDGRKMLSGDLNIYAIEGDEALSVDATDDIEGTKLGIRTGSSDEYTISFSRVQTDKNLYLRDTYTGKNVLRIEEGAQYTFYASPDSYLDGRFMIVGIGEQGVSTGVDANNAEEKATKYIKDDTMYILKNGLKYNSLGQRVQ